MGTVSKVVSICLRPNDAIMFNVLNNPAPKFKLHHWELKGYRGRLYEKNRFIVTENADFQQVILV